MKDHSTVVLRLVVWFSGEIILICIYKKIVFTLGLYL